MEVEKNPLYYKTAKEVIGSLGTKVRGPQGFPAPKMNQNLAVPDTFDARDQWGAWIHPIRDQAQCGSCWAFGATEAFTDRFTIDSQGAIDVIMSPQDLVSCDTTDYGCGGGYLDHAWEYLTNTGCVSDSCDPYQSQSGVSPQCPATCQDGSAEVKYKCQAGSMIEATTPDQIKAEIYAHGPVETGFDVYQDFFSYSTGVY